MKECARCSTPLDKKNQGSLCRACREKVNQPPKVVGREYTARELAEALLALSEEQQGWLVSLGYPFNERLVIEASNAPEGPYVWIGDPDA